MSFAETDGPLYLSNKELNFTAIFVVLVRSILILALRFDLLMSILLLKLLSGSTLRRPVSLL